MKNDDLLPCPFCGNKNVKVYESENMHGQASDWVVRCVSDKWNGACGAFISYLTKARAIEVWNQRTSSCTRIDPADPATLPPDNGRSVLLTIRLTGVNDCDDEYDELQVIKARYWHNDIGWADDYLDPVEIELPDQTVTAIAWEPWPQPVPYQNKE